MTEQTRLRPREQWSDEEADFIDSLTDQDEIDYYTDQLREVIPPAVGEKVYHCATDGEVVRVHLDEDGTRHYSTDLDAANDYLVEKNAVRESRKKRRQALRQKALDAGGVEVEKRYSDTDGGRQVF